MHKNIDRKNRGEKGTTKSKPGGYSGTRMTPSSSGRVEEQTRGDDGEDAAKELGSMEPPRGGARRAELMDKDAGAATEHVDEKRAHVV